MWIVNCEQWRPIYNICIFYFELTVIYKQLTRLAMSFFGDGEEGILADGAGNEEPSGTFAVKRGKFLNSAWDNERFCPIFGGSVDEDKDI